MIPMHMQSFKHLLYANKDVFYNIFILQACAVCREKYFSKIDSLISATTFVPSNICFYYSLLTKLFHDAAAIIFFGYASEDSKKTKNKNVDIVFPNSFFF